MAEMEPPRTAEPPPPPAFEEYETSEEYDQSVSEKKAQDKTQPQKKVTRKLIKTADYRIQVEDVNKSSQGIEATVSKFGGFISGTNLTNTLYSISNNITIRVPADQFEALLDAVGKEALFVNYKRINATDVTEEYLDIETRLNAKKTVRDRYIEILRNKAKTVEEILQAEAAILDVTEEIEAKEGRLKYLKDRVGLSTINLEIYQEVEAQEQPIVYRDHFGKKALRGLRNGWELIQSILIGLITIWPIVILVGVLIWQRRKIFPRRKKVE